MRWVTDVIFMNAALFFFRLVKKGVYPKPITLSIGDGANDVAMIQEAQVLDKDFRLHVYMDV